jgi:hypothetical protein
MSHASRFTVGMFLAECAENAEKLQAAGDVLRGFCVGSIHAPRFTVGMFLAECAENAEKLQAAGNVLRGFCGGNIPDSRLTLHDGCFSRNARKTRKSCRQLVMRCEGFVKEAFPIHASRFTVGMFLAECAENAEKLQAAGNVLRGFCGGSIPDSRLTLHGGGVSRGMRGKRGKAAGCW